MQPHLSIFLKTISPIFVIVGIVHLVLGVGAEVIAGANVGMSYLSDPVIDSQNRFYGVAFSIYGFLFYLCSTDLAKYQVVLRILLWIFFAAGCARIVSMVVYGLPSPFVIALFVTEILLPPLCIVWLSHTLKGAHDGLDHLT